MKLVRLSALALGLAVSASMSGAALAADIIEETGHDWSGFYVGAHAGYGWIDVKGAYSEGDGDFMDDGDGDFKMDDDNFLFGGQIGFNHQIDRVVLGIEADISFVDWNDKLINSTPELVSFDTDYLVSVRGRIGYAIDNALLYATAGGAWTNTSYYVNDHVDNQESDEKGTVRLNDIGFVVGGGVAYAFNENWSVRAEGLYYVWDDKKNATHLTHDSDDDDFVELDDIFVARIGIDFTF